jgi:hypothetical protein
MPSIDQDIKDIINFVIRYFIQPSIEKDCPIKKEHFVFEIKTSIYRFICGLIIKRIKLNFDSFLIDFTK